ncbi:rho guanine nucleotide exchange factor 33 isoform X1 [Rhinichthys klamathensis goyatoka]|uniref:rho guanine nucleotide exchange factor 33 isoform X1 n=2 Tax=Rhinichthys klamathensis goyatoka TaxID=3034132 RepID=UPI0024B52092|nr:rho guanine nucleotide exchange factor 33 isoform X1 [Rhinichthys klamathensis goyatoka]
MENGKIEGTGNDIDAIDLQLQAMWVELKSGVGSMVEDFATLRQTYSRLEEKVSTCQQETNDKILSLRNTLNTLQEDISTVQTQLSEVRSNQKDQQRDLDLMQSTQHRKGSRGEGSLDGHASPNSQTELNLIQHYISSLSANPNSFPEHDGQKKSPIWREKKNSRDLKEQNNSAITQRPTAALELLESERVYVSYLSLLLKANISFNGSENLNVKDKRPFPPSLRFLIQQHLELLHVLQERVLKSHWQGIMGDVFLRLTSKESDFLDHYVSYLRDLPECLTVVSLFSSSKSGSLLESDIAGDETRPSLHSLLLQPVQRIPEYHTLLQSLLQQTESEHPDYYLLLVSVQQLRSFITQYSHLLQLNQELLHDHSHALREHTHNLCTHQQERPSHTRKELSRSTVRQLYKVDYEKNYSSNSAQNDPSRRNRRYPDYEAMPYHYDPEIPSPVSFLSDSDSRHKAVSVPLRSIPETEGAGSALTDALGALFPYGTGDYRCSSPSHSSDSSIDIAFVHCSPSNSPPPQSHSRGRSAGGVVYRPNRACVSPDSADIVRPHPLQAVQRKSKSLNGLQMDSIDSHTHQTKNPAHPRLERQSSGKSRLRSSSPKHRFETHTDTEEQPRLINQKDPRSLVWEELNLRGVSDDYDHTPLSERGRKEGKGFRNSFKKLFKKKSSGDGKEKTTVKADCQTSGDLESTKAPHAGFIDRGTAV